MTEIGRYVISNKNNFSDTSIIWDFQSVPSMPETKLCSLSDRQVGCCSSFSDLCRPLQAGCVHRLSGEGWSHLSEAHLGVGECGGCSYRVTGTQYICTVACNMCV